MKKIVLLLLCVVAICFVGCKKQSLCGDSNYDFLWNDYNSVKAVDCYLKDHYREYGGDTILVKGYLDETFEYMEQSYPWLYLADKVWGVGEDYGHINLPIGMMGDTITTDYRNKLLYVKGTICWMYLDEGSSGYSAFLNVWDRDIDTITHK